MTTREPTPESLAEIPEIDGRGHFAELANLTDHAVPAFTTPELATVREALTKPARVKDRAQRATIHTMHRRHRRTRGWR